MAATSNTFSAERIRVPDDIATLDDAIRRAEPGATITIKQGVYRNDQPLRFTQAMTIVGATGNPKDVVLECTNGSAIIMEAETATLQSVSIGNHGEGDAVCVNQGTLELVKCDITSRAGSCVSVSGATASVVASSCTFHDAKGSGVLVPDNGSGTFEKCEFFGNTEAAVGIAPGGHPTVKGCDIHGGVCVGGNPTVTDCKIHDAKGDGVWVGENGSGTFERCDFFGNREAAVCIALGGHPTVKGCDIHGGVCVGGNPTVTDCKIHDAKGDGVWVGENGSGTFERCDIFGNAESGVCVDHGGNPTVKDCKIHNGKQSGVYVGRKGNGVFKNNTFYGNAGGAWFIDRGAGTVRRIGNSPNK